MPKFIGHDVPYGHKHVLELEDNDDGGAGLVRLTYSQACLMPDGTVLRSLDTTDRGSVRCYAKRWYRWYAPADAVLANPRSTPAMRARASRADAARPANAL